MGTRNIRIRFHELKAKLPETEGRNCHVVTIDDKTYSGTVNISGDFLILKDANIAWYNRAKHTHKIPVAEIREIIVDEVTEW